MNHYDHSVTVTTTRCYDNLTSAKEVGKYFTYLSTAFESGFRPFYSVVDDFGCLVPVEI